MQQKKSQEKKSKDWIVALVVIIILLILEVLAGYFILTRDVNLQAYIGRLDKSKPGYEDSTQNTTQNPHY